MKKVIIFVVLLVVLAVCCRKEDFIANESPVLFAPNALSTKALILPDGSSTDFPTTEAFNVFAFANLTGAGPNYATPLMNDVEISYQTNNWKATSGTYLWPSTGSVDFHAYYPGTLNAVYDFSNTPEGIFLDNVSLGSEIGSQTDPLIANTLAQSAALKPAVSLVFKHIASQIVVAAKDATVTNELKGKISVESVVFKNMKTVGDYQEGATTGQGTWSNIGTNHNFTVFSGSQLLGATEKILASDGTVVETVVNKSAFVVIPEDILNGTAADQEIAVTYSIASYAINGFNYPATASQTVTIPLYGHVSDNCFKNGKRYVFHVGISLDGANNEIVFSPSVTGWDTEDISGITIDAVHATLVPQP